MLTQKVLIVVALALAKLMLMVRSRDERSLARPASDQPKSGGDAVAIVDGKIVITVNHLLPQTLPHPSSHQLLGVGLA